MPLWHINYIELKLPETQPVQKGYYDPPLCVPEIRRQGDVLIASAREVSSAIRTVLGTG